MKTLFTFLFIMSSTFIFAQKHVEAKGNTVTLNEVAPVWPGCEGTEMEKKNCFNQKLALHIQENFDFSNGYTEADKGSRIIVNFVINKEGKTVLKNVEGGAEAMQDEAKRVILLLPKMKPGTLGGKPTEIKYTVPFNL